MSVIVRLSLGRRMQDFRESAGKTQADVVAARFCSRATIQRLEAGDFKRGPVPLVMALCDFYDVPKAQTTATVEMTMHCQSHGWWEDYTASLPHWFAAYVELESEARRMLTFSPLVVPGLCQTKAYSHRTFTVNPKITTAQLAEQMEIRAKRQAAAFERENPLELVAVLQEADLIDDDHPELMQEQREHLIALGERGSVDIRVLPIGRTSFFRGMRGGFTLLEFNLPEILAGSADEKEEASIVYLEAHAGGRYIEKEPMLTEYRDMFTELESRSVSIKEYSA